MDEADDSSKIKDLWTKCFYCTRPATQTRPLRGHHVFGVINSNIEVPVCDECHALPTDAINALSKDVSKNTAPFIVNRAKGILLSAYHKRMIAEKEIETADEAIRLIQDFVQWFANHKKEVEAIEAKDQRQNTGLHGESSRT